jgi:hypothetical protein
VLNRQGGQVRVGYKITGCLPFAEHALKNFPVLLASMNHAHTRLIKPALHASDSFLERERAPMQTQIRAYPNKSGYYGPA